MATLQLEPPRVLRLQEPGPLAPVEATLRGVPKRDRPRQGERDPPSQRAAVLHGGVSWGRPDIDNIDYVVT